MGEVIGFSREFVAPRIRELKDKLPRFSKGLIIGPKMSVRPGSLTSSGGGFSEEQLRRAVLFWDQLVSPVNAVFRSPLTPEMEFLEKVGYLSCPVFSEMSGDLSEIIRRSYLDCFRKLESENPGSWAIATGPDALDFGTEMFEDTRGAQVELYRAVPVPESGVPLEEVLEFKFKRQDEVAAFNNEIDGFFQLLGKCS